MVTRNSVIGNIMMKSGETSGHMRSGRSLVFQIAMGEQASPIAWSQRLPAQRVAWILPPKKRQGREVLQSLRVEPGASHPVWKAQSKPLAL